MYRKNKIVPTCTHWGNYLVETDGKKIIAVNNYDVDSDASPIGQSLLSALDPGTRIPQPMVRAGYLKEQWDSDGSGRGREPFVPVSWATALDLAAEALQRIKDQFGNEAIYGGSYGWASAGRFHHAQGQLHRFLNHFGGYTYSVNSYSTAAAQVIMQHVLAIDYTSMFLQAPTPEDIAKHAKTVVLFGGAAMKNTQVNAGGLGEHTAKAQLLKIKQAGVEVFNISPIRDDAGDFLGAHWLSCRPGSDVAIMLGIAYTLVQKGLHDQAFLDRYTVGFGRFIPYLKGETDGTPKDAEWACRLSGVSADVIEDLALRLSNGRSVLGISWSLQRQEFGEQTYWMVTTLAAMLGYIGLPGGGVAYGYGCIHNIGFIGRKAPDWSMGALPQGNNQVEAYIPVARITDMLNNPNGKFDYNGQELRYPDIKLIYWAGGNPFHHHQDLNRLRKAWEKPDTIIVNDSVWTATARHADIVFPCTTVLERNDFGGSSHDCYISPMRQAVNPYAESKNDYDIFLALAAKLGLEDGFSEGRDEMGWIRYLYGVTRDNAAYRDVELPGIEEFWNGEQISVAEQVNDAEFILENFRKDPLKHPLGTPSGRIEIFSETIHAFAYDDCQGYPRWYEREEWLGSRLAEKWPLHLVSNQPKTRLHSQLDHGITSRKHKIKDRERARMNPADAVGRNIADRDVVRVFNDRGACLAGIELSDSISRGVIELPTGAMFDPVETADGSLEVHGNPNVLTRDQPTSKLAQGPTAHSCLVEVELFGGELPAVTAYTPPGETFDR